MHGLGKKRDQFFLPTPGEEMKLLIGIGKILSFGPAFQVLPDLFLETGMHHLPDPFLPQFLQGITQQIEGVGVGVKEGPLLEIIEHQPYRGLLQEGNPEGQPLGGKGLFPELYPQADKGKASLLFLPKEGNPLA